MKTSERRLKKLEEDIEKLKAQIAEIGVVRPGSLSRQYKDPSKRRGAYHQLSYTYRMRSRTQYVRSGFLVQVSQQIRDYKRLKKLVDKWIALGIKHSQLSMKSEQG